MPATKEAHIRFASKVSHNFGRPIAVSFLFGIYKVMWWILQKILLRLLVKNFLSSDAYIKINSVLKNDAKKGCSIVFFQ